MTDGQKLLQLAREYAHRVDKPGVSLGVCLALVILEKPEQTKCLK